MLHISSNNNIMTVCSQNNQLRTYARFHKTWLSLRYRFSRLFKTWDFGENVIMLYKMSWNAYTCSIKMAENRKSKAWVYSSDTEQDVDCLRVLFHMIRKGKNANSGRRFFMNLSSYITNCWVHGVRVCLARNRYQFLNEKNLTPKTFRVAPGN